MTEDVPRNLPASDQQTIDYFDGLLNRRACGQSLALEGHDVGGTEGPESVRADFEQRAAGSVFERVYTAQLRLFVAPQLPVAIDAHGHATQALETSPEDERARSSSSKYSRRRRGSPRVSSK